MRSKVVSGHKFLLVCSQLDCFAIQNHTKFAMGKCSSIDINLHSPGDQDHVHHKRVASNGHQGDEAIAEGEEDHYQRGHLCQGCYEQLDTYFP